MIPLRILIWRLKYESSDEVYQEGIEKTTMAWNNLQKIGNSFSPEEGSTLVEEQILSTIRSLALSASDQGTTGFYSNKLPGLSICREPIQIM